MDNPVTLQKSAKSQELAAHALQNAAIPALAADRSAIDLTGPVREIVHPPVSLGADMQPLVLKPGWATTFAPAKVFGAQIKDALVAGTRFSVISRDGSLIRESLYMCPKQRAAELIAEAAEPEESDAALAYLVGNAGYWNYYHWTIQCLAGLALIPQLKLPDDVRLVTPVLNDWQRRSLELAGYADLPSETLGKGRLRKYRTLIYPSLLSGASAAEPWPGMRPFYSGIRKRIADGTDGAPLIFISRKDSQKRRMLNEDELCEALEGIGFRIVTLTGMTLDEQIQTFAKAKLIVAPHGGGLANLVYCEPDTVIYELHPSHYVNGCFFRLAQLFGLRYWGDTFNVDAGDRYRHQVGWTVNVGYVRDRISSIMERVRVASH